MRPSCCCGRQMLLEQEVIACEGRTLLESRQNERMIYMKVINAGKDILLQNKNAINGKPKPSWFHDLAHHIKGGV